MRHEFDDGKYAVELTPDCRINAYRNGEMWQDLTGNNLVYWMLVEVAALKHQRDSAFSALELCVDHVSANSSSGREAISAYNAAKVTL